MFTPYSPRNIGGGMAAAGAKVACVDVNADLLGEAVQGIAAGGGTCAAFSCDVTDSQRVGEVVGEVVKMLRVRRD